MDKESTIRSGRKIGFTTLYNNILHDKRLSLKAKGLFAIMQSLPCNWRYTVSGLVTVTGEGRTTVRAALNELYIAGYLVRSQGARRRRQILRMHLYPYRYSGERGSTVVRKPDHG